MLNQLKTPTVWFALLLWSVVPLTPVAMAAQEKSQGKAEEKKQAKNDEKSADKTTDKAEVKATPDKTEAKAQDKTEDKPSPQDSPRKIVKKLEAPYPPLAKQGHLTGVVKLIAVVTPEGNVKSVRTLGGNPILAAAAEEVIKQWKFEAGPKETSEPVALRFDTPQ
jgi:TonB family protein